ncbi:MAG: hypothetical protein EON86_07790, partial [Brevundimonas sp.]
MTDGKSGLTRRQAAALAASPLLMGAALPEPVPAYRWRNVKVGAGGFIPGIVFSRVERDLAYARSDMGGAYRWDSGLSRWLPLQDDTPIGSDFGVESLAPDPVDPNVVHAAVGVSRNEPAAILRSGDRGTTWRRTPVDFRMGGNEDGRGLGERLAIDPNDTRILYFGSRHDGLQRSVDGGLTWRRVESFPVRGQAVSRSGPTHGGLSFVIFDPASGTAGAGSRTILVGVADTGGPRLIRSTDAGVTWAAVDGGPRPDLSAAKAELDDRGVLFLTCTLGIGPNGVTDGQVWRLDTRTDQWRDITPPRPLGGFMGVAIDRTKPGVVMVSTLNRWQPGDTLWRSTDDGQTWTSLRERARRDVRTTPYLYWGNDEPDFGWWIAALAIDPFDGERVVYATGATVYATTRVSEADRHAPTDWTPWVEG